MTVFVTRTTIPNNHCADHNRQTSQAKLPPPRLSSNVAASGYKGAVRVGKVEERMVNSKRLCFAAAWLKLMLQHAEHVI